MCTACNERRCVHSQSFCFLFGTIGEAHSDDMSRGYDYLLGMKLWSLTLERVKQMENELEAKTEEMAKLKVCIRF